MKILRILSAFLLTSFYSNAQVTAITNLPQSIAPNSDVLLEVKLNKGAITNFAKYQVDVPAGVTVTEGDSKTGNFTFEDNRAKIVWVSIPTETEFIITFKVNTGSASGTGVFNQKFYFLDNSGPSPSKKEVEFEPVNVTFDPSGAKTLASLGGNPGPSTVSNEPKGSVTSMGEPVSTNTASETPVPNVEKSTSTTTTSSGESASNTATNTGTVETKPVSETKPTENKPVETTVKTTAPETKPVNTETSSAKTSSSSPGLIFRVQISASTTDPGKAKFSNAGNVTISREDGMYKVLVGSYNTKEEALEKMNQLKGVGYNGFIVRYQNGVRVK